MAKFLDQPHPLSEHLQVAFDCLLASPHPAEAFGELAGRMLDWFACDLAVLQVEAEGAAPLFFQSGRALPLPGIAAGAEPALAGGQVLLAADLATDPLYAEDTTLAQAGLRSAARLMLVAGGNELGRLGLFAHTPGHFDQQDADALNQLRGPLGSLCRMAALAAKVAEGAELRFSISDVADAIQTGPLSVLRACRAALGRLAPAAGTLAVVVTHHDPPVVLLDQAGVAVPGTPAPNDQRGWLAWLSALPPEGRVDQGVWATPIIMGDKVMGGLAVVLGAARGDAGYWSARLEPVSTLLLSVVAQGDSFEALEELTRSRVVSLAAGVADDIGNLMTELALHADLLKAARVRTPEAAPRLEALGRLVQKGTAVGVRLENLVTSHSNIEDSESLSVVIDRVCDHLRSYRGGKHLVVDKALGKLSWTRLNPDAVEAVLLYLLLALAQRREAGSRVLIRAHTDPGDESNLVLWLADSGGGNPWDAGLKPAFTAARNLMQRAGGDLTRVPLEPGAQAIALRIPCLAT